MRYPHILIRLGLWTSTAFVLVACATSNKPSTSGNWQEIGLSNNGNVHHAIDKDSVRRQGHVATFRDKKTIMDVSKEQYGNIPAYKTALSDWEIDCSRKIYRLSALQLLDGAGRSLGQYRYSGTDLQPMSVVRGGAIERQYELVCTNKL